MITITTKRGIIELPCPPADDAETIKGNCGHGNPLLGDCNDCDLMVGRACGGGIKEGRHHWQPG